VTVDEPEERATYLNAAVDQLKVALREHDGTTAAQIMSEMFQRYPTDADALLDFLITRGQRRQTGISPEGGLPKRQPAAAAADFPGKLTLGNPADPELPATGPTTIPKRPKFPEQKDPRKGGPAT
jgi:hypothetical protein